MRGVLVNLRVVLLSYLLGFFVLAAAGQGLAPPASSHQAAGQHVFATRCASCHGTNAMGGELRPRLWSECPCALTTNW